MQNGKNLMHEAWHDVDRIGAEALLEAHEPGSFIFRKDDYAKLLEERLKEELAEKVTCFTLSYLDHKKQVVDHTIVSKGGEWFFYDDDALLTGTAYKDFSALLKSMKRFARHPIIKHSKAS